MKQSDAEVFIKNLGFTCEVWYLTEDGNGEPHYVIGQNIVPETIINTKIPIRLRTMSLSNSPTKQKTSDTVEVPNVVGMEQRNAAQLLESSGLNFSVWTFTEDVGEEYNVIGQSIIPNTIVDKGTIIKLQLSAIKK